MNEELRKAIQEIWQTKGGCISFEPENCDFCEKVGRTVNFIRNRENGMFIKGNLDTVLGEEGHTLGTHFDCKRCLKEHTMASLVQPLTEGEEKCGLTERECRLLGGNCYDEPQESNKEEVFNTEWMKGKSLSELSKEPSKKEKKCCGNNIKL